MPQQLELFNAPWWREEVEMETEGSAFNNPVLKALQDVLREAANGTCIIVKNKSHTLDAAGANAVAGYARQKIREALASTDG